MSIIPAESSLPYITCSRQDNAEFWKKYTTTRKLILEHNWLPSLIKLFLVPVAKLKASGKRRAANLYLLSDADLVESTRDYWEARAKALRAMLAHAERRLATYGPDMSLEDNIVAYINAADRSHQDIYQRFKRSIPAAELRAMMIRLLESGKTAKIGRKYAAPEKVR